jgi:hypothetical protein
MTGSSTRVRPSKTEQGLAEAAQTGLAVRAYHRPLGYSFFALPPGRYEIQVSCHWMFTSHMRRSALTVEVEPGSVPFDPMDRTAHHLSRGILRTHVLEIEETHTCRYCPGSG